MSILKQQEAGSKVIDICREQGISDATFYNWKAKYGGMDTSQLSRLRELDSFIVSFTESIILTIVNIPVVNALAGAL